MFGLSEKWGENRGIEYYKKENFLVFFPSYFSLHPNIGLKLDTTFINIIAFNRRIHVLKKKNNGGKLWDDNEKLANFVIQFE